MPTTTKEISEWFDRGVEAGATHMIVACDTFDYEDYPVYVQPGEDVRVKEKLGSMQKVMEIYKLSMDKQQQLDQHRVFNR